MATKYHFKIYFTELTISSNFYIEKFSWWRSCSQSGRFLNSHIHITFINVHPVWVETDIFPGPLLTNGLQWPQRWPDLVASLQYDPKANNKRMHHFNTIKDKYLSMWDLREVIIVDITIHPILECHWKYSYQVEIIVMLLWCQASLRGRC